ncbi:hypothetical protein, partial [Sedimenticola sp.]|uniref:hypothetical protein n=1 Tax=Sedimenticola sp. TaxID=1940285 RepID=UPI003D101826
MSPEAQIRELLNRAETAVESRSISALLPLLSNTYSNAAGQDKQAVMRLLAGYFVAHQSIHLLTQVNPIELTGEERARVTLFVAVAGEPVDA